MPKRSSGKSRGRKTNGTTKILSKTAKILQHISDDQDTQVHGRTPDIPDVPRMKLKRQKVHTFSKSITLTGVNANPTIDQTGSYYFTLQQSGDSTIFAQLFDQYRIQQVSVEFIPLYSSQNGSPFITVLDYDDNAALTSFQQALDYDTSMRTQIGQEQVRTLVPRAALAAYSGAFTSYSSASSKQWFDVASPNVQYYGVKWYVPAMTANTTGQIFTVTGTVIYQFRQSR